MNKLKLRPHLVEGWWGCFEKSNRGNTFEGRHWALCWCRLDHSAKIHRMAGVRRMKSSRSLW